MIHHPIVLGIKLVLLVIFTAVLIALYGVLSPQQFLIAAIAAGFLFVVLVIVLWVAAFKVLGRPDSKLGQRFILSTSSSSEDGYVAPSEALASMVGEQGVTVSALRPSGSARFDGKRLSVVTDGDFIPQDTPVAIVSVAGARIVVRKVDEAETEENAT